MSKEQSNEQRTSKSEQIIDILLNGEHLPQEDIEQIRDWLADADKAAEKMEAFERKFLEEIRYEKNPKYTPQMWAALAQRLGIEPGTFAGAKPGGIRMPLLRRVAVRVAAVLIPVLVAVTAGGLWINKAGDKTADPFEGMVTVSVSADGAPVRNNDAAILLAGNAAHILPDRSTVRLGAGSEIRHAETFEGGRRVELRGEAHFNVTKAADKNDRFTVHTEVFDITVLGTEFDVHSPAGDAYSTINLYHGSVEVSAGGKTVRMKPTDRLHYDHNTRETTLSTIPYGLLRYDEMPGLVFEKAKMSDVIAKIGRDFGIRFSVDGGVPPDRTLVNGSFTSFHSLEEVMSVMAKISGEFDYEITDNEIRIKPKNI